MVGKSVEANNCVESHLREFLEQGFEVAVVSAATAAAQPHEGDGCMAALVNFRFIADTVWTTNAAVEAMKAFRRSGTTTSGPRGDEDGGRLGSGLRRHGNHIRRMEGDPQ